MYVNVSCMDFSPTAALLGGPDGKECAKDQDCKLSDWGAWDDCSATCFGMRQRSKTITQYATAIGRLKGASASAFYVRHRR